MKALLLIASLILMSGCGSDSDDPVAAEVTTFTVTNSGATDYILNGVNDPNITLRRGVTYTFNLSVSGHPFYIKSVQSDTTANAYNTGVTTNGAQTGTLTFVVPMTAPNTLYYNCEFHASMTGIITITN